MKFLLAFFLLSSASAEEKTVCKSIGDAYYKGQAVLIDNDSSGFVPTTGDVSISNNLTTGSNSTFPSIKAICTLTAANPLDSPPFCTLETTLADGKIMATGTPPELVVMGGTGAYYRASGMMTTAEDFEQSNGFISFNARIDFCIPVDGGPNPITEPPTTNPITIPPTPVCKDDKNWSTLYNSKKFTCKRVAKNSVKHCFKVKTASTACPVTCGTCPVPVPFQ